MQRRPDFSFPPGSPARPVSRPPPPPRPSEEEEEIRWLQASRQGSPDCNYYYHSSSGTPSPPLWRGAYPDRPYPASAGSSPSSREQVIAGYRREMLDLVRGLPESAYELSLRDIVEHHHRPLSSSPSSATSPPPSTSAAPLPTPPPPPPPPLPTSNATSAAAVDKQGAKHSKTDKQGRTVKKAAVRRQRSRSMERSVSLDTGLLIRFFIPLSIGRKAKKKVSPNDAATGKKKKKQETKKEEARQKQEEEWWTKSEFSETSGASSCRTSSTGSSNSNSSDGGGGGNGAANGGNGNPRTTPPPLRSRSRKRNGCYAFLRAHKSKNGVSQD